jgi:protein-arginine deiminase
MLLVVGACSEAPPPPKPVADLVVDANRNGLLDPDDPAERAGKASWDSQHGAIFVANLDDDDKKGSADADDEVVNGAADLLDLSPIAVRPWPQATSSFTGTLTVDPASVSQVRLFRVDGPAGDPASYTAVQSPLALTALDLKKGVTLALEGRDFVTSTAQGAWTGLVDFELTVTNTVNHETATDHAILRVAPLILQYNTAPTQAVFYSQLYDDTRPLVDGIQPACSADSMSPTGLDLNALNLDYDQWAQDYFDVGYTSKPGPGGKPVGMKVAIRSAQDDRTAGEVAQKYFRGPDFAAVYKHGVPLDSQSYSLNSFGNWDVIPPYTKGDVSYPLGRNLWGAVPGNPDYSPDAVYADFIRAQKVQPAFNIDTSWLLVGHVDEFTSWVKTITPRGWGLLASSPKLARQMLMDLQAKGYGSTQMFVGKTDDMNQPAAISIDALLADPKIMAASQAAQMAIDDDIAALTDEIGLDPSEVTPMPFLWERVDGALIAYQPGTVNLLYFDGRVVIPDPFGPIIDGQDPFKTDLHQRLEPLGLQVYFADDWDEFHIAEGEVHCGTNVSRDMSAAWWESGR